MRSIADMIGHLSGPRQTVVPPPFVPEPPRVAKVIDPKEMFNDRLDQAD